jgi:prepilin-type N-terminal cleavage/methylation domain-containing protein/prepilin-type processing-associated H-X9-DG protein
MKSQRNTSIRARGFTIVELMVVIAIVALLMGLLLPGIGMVRKSAFAAKSQSNLRQWGLGTIAYANLHEERLPWEGLKDANQMTTNLANPAFWANAIPPFVDQRPYREINQEAFDNQVNVPFADGESIFIDPSAQPDQMEPWGYGEPGTQGIQRQFYFNYVPNSQLNNTLLSSTNSPQYSPDMAMRLTNLQRADVTVLMLEMRANPQEVGKNDVHYARDLKRHRADWKRFAGRHYRGGHMLFGDGHVGWVTNEKATTNVQGTREPSEPSGDWNTSTLIWDPMGPALDEN